MAESEFNNSLINQIEDAYREKSKPIYFKGMTLPTSQYDHKAALAELETKYNDLMNLIRNRKFSEALEYGKKNDLLTAYFEAWLEKELSKNTSMKGGRRLRRRKSVRRKRVTRRRRQTRRG